MNSHKITLLVLTLILCLGFSACGKGTVPPSILPLTITTTSLPVAVVQKSYSTTLTVTGGVGPYNWTVTSGSLPNGVSLSSSGAITGTPTAAGTSPITVQVTDSQTPTAAVAAASFTFTVNNPLTITSTTFKAGTINVPYSALLSATGGAPPYIWALAGGTLPAGLTLNPQGAITGTPTTAGNSNFTLQVTDSESPAVVATANASLTISGSIGRLNGSYAFLFHGFKNGNLILQAGSFVADGLGTITSGIMDSNSTAGPQTKIPLAGTYTVDSNGHGTMTLNTGAGAVMSYEIANATNGYTAMIQNGNGQDQTAGSGIIKSQTTTSFDLSLFGGTWTFGGYGADPANARYASAGDFTLDATGALTNGVRDANDNGTFTAGSTFSGALTKPDATTGRGTVAIGTVSVTGTSYSYYVVSNSEFILIGLDPVTNSTPLILFSAKRQVGIPTFSNGTLSGPVISELSTVVSPNGTPVPDVSLGNFSFDGKGAFTSTIDDNTGGTLSQSTPSGTYSVSSTGRTTFTGWGTNPPVLFLSSFNYGFVLGTDPQVTYGEMEAQIVRSVSNAAFSGAYAGGTLSPVLATQTVEDDLTYADGATPGNYSVTYDTSGPGGPQQNLVLKATYTVDPNTGRFTLIDTNNNTVGIGYVVGMFVPQRVVILTTTKQPVLNAIQK